MKNERYIFSRWIWVYCGLAALLLLPAHGDPTPPTALLDQPVRFVGAWSPFFEANNGQFDEDILFVSRGMDYSMALYKNGMSLTLVNKQDEPKQSASTKIDMRFLDSSPYPTIDGSEALPRKMKYYVEQDTPEFFEVTAYQKVKYQSIYPGIDLFFSCNRYYLEYYFVLSPRANLRDVVFEIKGADKLALSEDGDLVIHTAAGVMIRPSPRLFEEVDGHRKEIPGDYVLLSRNRVGFDAGAYNQMANLIIDPVLIFFDPKENWVQKPAPK